MQVRNDDRGRRARVQQMRLEQRSRNLSPAGGQAVSSFANGTAQDWASAHGSDWGHAGQPATRTDRWSGASTKSRSGSLASFGADLYQIVSMSVGIGLVVLLIFALLRNLGLA